jgi:hypothetical protein
MHRVSLFSSVAQAADVNRPQVRFERAGNQAVRSRSCTEPILVRMEIIPSSLLAAASDARDRLATLARDGARANAAGAAGAPLRAAGVAREAIFADALEAALHARLEELKSVAK